MQIVIDMIPISYSTLDNLSDPIFVNSSNGVYIACNKAFEDLVSIPKNKILGKTIHDVWPAHLANLYAQADSELRASRGEQRLQSFITTSKKSEGISGVYYKNLIDCNSYHDKNAILGIFKTLDENQSIFKYTENPLTNREVDVLRLASKGFSNKIIASDLNISNHTVADYFKSIHIKLDVHNRIEAITVARQLGLIITA